MTCSSPELSAQDPRGRAAGGEGTRGLLAANRRKDPVTPQAEPSQPVADGLQHINASLLVRAESGLLASFLPRGRPIVAVVPRPRCQ